MQNFVAGEIEKIPQPRSTITSPRQQVVLISPETDLDPLLDSGNTGAEGAGAMWQCAARRFARAALSKPCVVVLFLPDVG